MSEIESINEIESDLLRPQEVDRFADPKEARKKAMDYLARREYARHELEQKLITAGFESTIAIDAVSKLAKEGLQDERRFVESFVRSRIGQGKGPVRIRQELGERGVSQALIDEVFDTVTEDWFELAQQIRTKKFGAERPRDFEEKARQMRFLQYRGFETAHIQAAVSPHGED